MIEVFKPKDKKEIQKGFLWLDVKEFQDQYEQYKILFKEDLPDEYYPLIYHIHEDLKKRNVILKYQWGYTEINKTVRGEHTRFILKPRNECKYVCIAMFPYRKRKIVMDFTVGNEFRMTTFDQYKRFINAYEL